MAIRPSPMTYKCRACGWSKTVSPVSDALMPWDFYERCPNCGNAKLDQQQPSLLDKFADAISRIKK